MESREESVSVTEAALALSASYPQTMRWLLTGQLSGKKEDGRWRIDASSVERLKRERGRSGTH
jgi:hypothetical protein